MTTCNCSAVFENGVPPEPSPNCKVHASVKSDYQPKANNDLAKVIKVLERIAIALEIKNQRGGTPEDMGYRR